MDTKTKITWIDPDDIMEHPNNPRKDLGDLTELTESIRTVGIMQNLTVINREKALAAALNEQENGNRAGELEEYVNILEDSIESHIVLLGHRRLVAAKEAELERVPCIVADGMSLSEQISLMLVENIQRNALTVIEQAQSFQMMLDLGDTVKTVAEKTGFSQTTVRHRVEIAKLDPKLVKEKTEGEGFQLTITDMIALEEIDDINERNRILDDATDQEDISWEVGKYLQKQYIAEATERLKEVVLRETGIKLKDAPKSYSAYSPDYDTIFRRTIRSEGFELDSEVRDAVSKVTKECFLHTLNDEIRIAKKAEKTERKKTPKEIQIEERRAKTSELHDLCGTLRESWRVYLRDVISGKKKKPKEAAGFFEEVYNAAAFFEADLNDRQLIADLTGKPNRWSVEQKDKKECKAVTNAPITARLLYELTGSTAQHDTVDWNGYYEPDDVVLKTQELMERYGYREMNEQLTKLLDGTHENYERKKKK